MSEPLERIFAELDGAPEEHRDLVDRIKAGITIIRGATGELAITADALEAGMLLAAAWGEALTERTAAHLAQSFGPELEQQLASALCVAIDHAKAERVAAELAAPPSSPATPAPESSGRGGA